MKPTKEFKAAHLLMITNTQANLLDLMNEGVLSKETATMYILELEKKGEEIVKQLKE
jgi:hypothetical protein